MFDRRLIRPAAPPVCDAAKLEEAWENIPFSRASRCTAIAHAGRRAGQKAEAEAVYDAGRAARP
eukprot:gene8750-11214_t